ncbi:MAG: hypothetical protein J0M19_04550 [Sphingomonadales bacterium]|nr:hypothetical protein [Sphingomonadales bacterium]
MGGLVAIVGILAQAYRRRLEHKERIAELKYGNPSAAAPEPEAARIEQRLRVLERIATDKGATLAAEIDNLRVERIEN